MRSTGANGMLRTSRPYDELATLNLSGNGFNDLLYVAFGQSFTDSFDNGYDAGKMKNRAGQPNIYATDATAHYSVYAAKTPQAVRDVPVSFEAGANGNFTIHADLSSFDPTALVLLEDTKLHTMNNLMANSTYTFSSDTADAPARFILHFVPKADITVTDADCQGQHGLVSANLGSYSVGASAITWDSYTVTNAATSATVAVGNVQNNQVSVSNLPSGNYLLNLNINGYTATENITVNNAPVVTAAFTPSGNSVTTADTVNFANATANATSYDWQFGDGSSATLPSPSHRYTSAGDYTVTLTATNGTCQATATQDIHVGERTTGIANTKGQGLKITGYANTVTITFSNIADATVKVTVYDAVGRILVQKDKVATATNRYTLDMGEIPTGYYFVHVQGYTTDTAQKVFLSKE
jgi:hypothetical protein